MEPRLLGRGDGAGVLADCDTGSGFNGAAPVRARRRHDAWSCDLLASASMEPRLLGRGDGDGYWVYLAEGYMLQWSRAC